MLSFGPNLPGWVVDGVSVDFFGNTEVMICWRLALRGDLSTLVTVVDGTSFSPVRSGAELVLDLLVCNWNSSDDTSVTSGDKYCLGLFSFRNYGVVVCDIVAGGSCCSASTKVFGSHTVWFADFLTSSLESWTYEIFLFFTLISEIIPHGSYFHVKLVTNFISFNSLSSSSPAPRLLQMKEPICPLILSCFFFFRDTK
jgi:hypothetical protein